MLADSYLPTKSQVKIQSPIKRGLGAPVVNVICRVTMGGWYMSSKVVEIFSFPLVYPHATTLNAAVVETIYLIMT
jgi:hypothetical protein